MYWAGDAKSGIDRQDDLVCQSKSLCFLLGLPRGSDGKESACNARNPGLIPGSGRPLGEGMATSSSILAWRISWSGRWRATDGLLVRQ